MLALVVDDSAAMRHIQQKALEDLGWETVGAADGAEALKALGGAREFQVVLTNWHMPVMDGVALLAALRAMPQHRETPVVLISSDVEVRTSQAVANVRPSRVLMKPINAGMIAAVMKEVAPKAP